MEKERRPQAPLYLDCHDIQLIEGSELHAARRRLTQIKKDLGLSRKEKLSIWAYCKNNNITIDQVVPFYLRLLIVTAAISIGFAFGKKLLEYSCEYFRQHKIIWEMHTDNYMKGHTFIKAPATKKVIKKTIEVRRTKPQATVQGKDTLMTDTFITINFLNQ